ncbi:hypothetical protein BN946_scf185007.g152 [Trametes cinnabarina]|uniref:EF-hand domain-containing protein n=1 Tax=Pycnoporus cinnabarinus TaxID=5643 RepID=A0A060SKX3_PYCCI|nr:hypothetical protein BN946_scf185007.g152 [Trametes cinnabarina]
MFPLNLPRIFPTLYCDSGDDSAPTSRAVAAINTVKSAMSVPESELKRWRRTFESNAQTVVDGQKYLNSEQFVNAIAPKGDLSKIGRAQFATLFRVADTSKRGLVSWEDFVVFETILKRPDADYWIAFQYFDVDDSGTISYDEFKNVFNANIGPDAIPFDFDCDWVKLYLGKKNGAHVLGYNEFTQLMKGLQGERLRQAFKFMDKDQDGYIRPEQFKRIILEIAGHKLSDAVIERLPTLTTISPGSRISYSEVVAFYNVIREMDMVERIIREATAKSKDGRIDQSDFLNHCVSSTRYSLFTPMEASIIFHFAGRGNPMQRLALVDFGQLLDPRWKAPSEEVEPKTVSSLASFLNEFAHSAYNFGLGGLAGGFGATIVYPIDLGKQQAVYSPLRSLIAASTALSDSNQRSTVVGQLLYKNSFDCIRKVFRNEGFIGFYRGLGPQLIGVAPEKAIKLTVNDFIRSRAMDPETGRIALSWELFAGGAAGGCQVIFTNPLEIVKIRLQVQGEAAKLEGAVPKGAMHIIRQLGLLGLYKGASACLLRDIPFSAIYFPAYWHLKRDLFNEGYNGKQLSFFETLTSAAVAYVVSDGIHRLTVMVNASDDGQADAVDPGQRYACSVSDDAGRPIGNVPRPMLIDRGPASDREEGFRAFFKGGPARVIRSSPQFGFTLVAYEYLHKFLPYPWAGTSREVETRLTSQPEDMAQVRARNALRILLDVHGDFGRRSG